MQTLVAKKLRFLVAKLKIMQKCFCDIDVDKLPGQQQRSKNKRSGKHSCILVENNSCSMKTLLDTRYNKYRFHLLIQENHYSDQKQKFCYGGRPCVICSFIVILYILFVQENASLLLN
ncbi:Deoxyribodipyrimidine photo-lyase [Frankliniella fusca]|uniref:Deoxyribodipyrimidine photo-lyase n=1 Tax=Frankliniella fusca TaxID=407009 RepID=A0AAE1LA54_9NEOP|nr:Deoxyribodipyrimidine photo-lyase [Frankliniella fusca]